MGTPKADESQTCKELGWPCGGALVCIFCFVVVAKVGRVSFKKKMQRGADTTPASLFFVFFFLRGSHAVMNVRRRAWLTV